MGYSTKYTGTVMFDRPLDLNGDLAQRLDEIFDSARDAGLTKPPSTYCDLKFVNRNQGLKWNGAEKTDDLDEWFAYLIKHFFAPNSYVLNGSMLAQGEEVGDLWRLEVKDNVVTKIEIDNRTHDWKTPKVIEAD